MKKYGEWSGETPAKAIRNMLEFHEGKQAAKFFAERMVEADQIIEDAFYQAKGFTHTESASPEEYNLYKVVKVENEGKSAHKIVFDTSETNKETIFGMDDDESGRNKAWLDYWCMRLNRAFVNGWFGAKGVSSWPSDGYYEQLDNLFNKMQGR